MKKITIILLILSGGAGLLAQGLLTYTGQLSFDYSGSINGSFTADIESDSNATAGVILNGIDTSYVLLTAIQPNFTDSTLDAFIMLISDTVSPVEPITLPIGVPSINVAPSAFCIFLVDIDSTFLFGLLDMFVDSTGFVFSDSLASEVLSQLLESAYASVAGSVTLSDVSEDSISGQFSATALKADFPPPNIVISNGYFSLTAMDTFMVGTQPENPLPVHYNLLLAYPNPFNPTTTIEIALKNEGYYRLEILNLLGQNVAVVDEGYTGLGFKIFRWDASAFPSGMYFVRLVTATETKTQKLFLLK